MPRYPSGPTYFRDVKFLNFFFRHVLRDTEEKYKGFPWVSPCGPEMNYFKVQDTPIVFHSLSCTSCFCLLANVSRVLNISTNTATTLLYGGDLQVAFRPEDVCVDPEGRFYYPAPVRQPAVSTDHLR